ncbi:hypothetical protein ACTFIR_009648 [Dictyostelium discoideum]
MKYINLIFILICFYINYQSIGVLGIPTNEILAAKSILKSIYNFEAKNLEEICSYGCFICSVLWTRPKSLGITLISINSTRLTFTSFDFSIFGSLTGLILGENVQIQTVFYEKTLPLLKKLEYLEVSKQEQPFPDNFLPPEKLEFVQFNSISVPLSPIWFEGKIKRIYVLNTLPGFKYPKLTKKNTNIINLSLALNHIDTNIPSIDLFPNLELINFPIHNEMSQKGYKNFSLDSINQVLYKTVNSIEFQFINSGKEATIQKFTLQQSFISKLNLNYLIIDGIGFTLDQSIGYLDFSKMSDKGFLLKVEGSCDIFKGCKNSNCVVMPKVAEKKYRNEIYSSCEH